MSSMKSCDSQRVPKASVTKNKGRCPAPPAPLRLACSAPAVPLLLLLLLLLLCLVCDSGLLSASIVLAFCHLAPHELATAYLQSPRSSSCKTNLLFSHLAGPGLVNKNSRSGWTQPGPVPPVDDDGLHPILVVESSLFTGARSLYQGYERWLLATVSICLRVHPPKRTQGALPLVILKIQGSAGREGYT